MRRRKKKYYQSLYSAPKKDSWIGWVWLMLLLFCLAVWAIVIFVLYHFLSKVW